MDIVTAALKGDRRALARLLTWAENGTQAGRDAVAALYPKTGTAHIIGITGSTGAGKSTLVNRLAGAYRDRDQRLAVVAVDPTSPYSGGALLGDRLRMRDLVTDEGVFIRSMASRGHPGGIAHATRDVVAILDAVGFPIILVETVGAGQAQVEVAQVVHTVVLVEAPGMGDDIQALKAGLMEVADVIVVNKADRPEARQTVRALQSVCGSTRMAGHHGAETPADDAVTAAPWEVPILQTVALENQGVAELVEALTKHRRYLEESGCWETLQQQHARAEIENWLQHHILALLDERVGEARRQDAIEAVQHREEDPASVAERLLREILIPEASS